MTRQFVLTTAIVVCVLSFSVRAARGELVPIAITGQVTAVGDERDFLEGKISVGDLITGVYIYDSSTLDSEPSPVRGLYEHYAPPAGIFLTIGEFVFMTDPQNVHLLVAIANDVPAMPIVGGSYDSYSVESYNNLPLSNGTPLTHISLAATGPTDIFSSDTLPTTAPDLDAGWRWSRIEIWIQGCPRERVCFGVSGNLTSAILIPEPATITILVLGGLALLKTRSSCDQKPENKVGNHNRPI